MHFYRAYGQPDLPEKYTFRVFGLDVSREDNLQYSRALKNACIKNAGPRPQRPSRCPRCRLAKALFSTQVCYKAGIAGAWNMICMSCNQVHVPNQRGPTDEGLQKIEAIRARDHEVYLERKAKKAKQRTKARAIPPKEDSDEERAVVASAGKPFGILNNTMGEGSSTGGVQKKPKSETPVRHGTVMHAPNNCHMKGVLAYGRKREDTDDKPRTVELVLWEHDKDARVEQVPVQFGHELFLYEFEHFKKLRGVCLFERYAFEVSLWCDLPWMTSPIYLSPEDDAIFIRAMGIRCRGFGRQLDRYQRMHGLALRPALGIRAKVNIPPARHQWLVIWGPHGGAPEIYLVDLSMADGLDDDARLALPWAHLLADAPFLLIWRETETGWAVVAPGISSGVLEAPITLVAHPAAELLLGSGEAIAWLEDWRMRGGPRSRPSSPTNSYVRGENSRNALPTFRATRRLPLPATKENPYTAVHEAQPPLSPAPQPMSVRQSSRAGEHAAAPSQGGGSSAHKAEPINVVFEADKRPAERVALGDSKGGTPACPNLGPTHKTEASSATAVLGADKRAAARVALGDRKVGAPAHPNPRAAPQSTGNVGKARPTARNDPLAARAGKRHGVLVALGDSMADSAAVDLAVKQGHESCAPAKGHASDEGKQSAAHIPVVSSKSHPAARPKSLSAQKAPAIPLRVPHANVSREPPTTSRQGEVTAHAAKGGVQGHKRPVSPSSGEEIGVLDGPTPARAIPSPSKKSRLVGVYCSAASRVGASDDKPAAEMHTEDIIVIENPSDELKRSFTNKARASAASTPTANNRRASSMHPSASTSTDTGSHPADSSDDEVEVVEGPSFIQVSDGSSDDDVEIVDGTPVVPKRRVLNVNGKQFIDLT